MRQRSVCRPREREVEVAETVVGRASSRAMARGLGVVLAATIGSFAATVAWGAPDATAPSRVVAFEHASVVPMDAERILPDQTVIVADGEIVAVGPAGEADVPAGAVVVDARGRFLMPALCDMHVHLVGEAWNMMFPEKDRLTSAQIPFEQFFFPFIANGVTTVQSMSATPEELALRARIADGELLGPRLVLARMIDGPEKAWPPPISTWVASGVEAEAAVRGAEQDGYDKIKVYSFLSRESYDAITATSRELHMDVIGHIPVELSVEYVLDSGQRLIAHSEEVMKHAHGDYSPEKIEYYARIMAEKGVWVSPTLVTTRAILEVLDEPEKVFSRPEASYHQHPMQQGVWRFIVDRLYRPIPAEAREQLRVGFESFQKPFTKSFFDKGGKLLVGTDTLFPGLVPGFAVHRELQELVAIGLTPYQALRTATVDPFEYLRESDRAGTVSVGKHTDLLLVEGNPLEDVTAASRIAGVIVQGRWLDAAEIHRKLEELAAPADGAGAAPAGAPVPATAPTGQ